MTLQIWFWLIYAFALIFGLWGLYPLPPSYPYPWRYPAGFILFFVLIGILGWQVFGSPVKHG